MISYYHALNLSILRYSALFLYIIQRVYVSRRKSYQYLYGKYLVEKWTPNFLSDHIDMRT